MAASAKLSITLPAKRAAAVRKAVKSGAYASTEAVVLEALALWQQTQQLDDDHLRKLWDEGIASGTAPGEWNKDEFLKEARRRKAAKAKRARAAQRR